MVEATDTDERRISSDDLLKLGLPTIHPDTWIAPSETFPGEIVESYYRDANDGYKAANTFRPAQERIAQWYIRVKRLDAVVDMPDGSQKDAMARFWSIDLEKYDQRKKTMVPVGPQFRKEYEIITEFNKVFDAGHDVESLVGKKAMFEFWPKKKMASGRVADNVLIPTSVLEPTYTFDGEVQHFEGRDDYDDDTSTNATSGDNLAGAINSAEADQALAKWYVGQTVEQAQSQVQNMPTELINDHAGDVASGSAAARLISSGLLAQTSDGILGLTS